ncbi:DUF6289 family protein [Brevundimonas sp.]|uniref:DUF6289 family protein n=1 Tax=Brevundimonas sp. TaxID=1871086 RepID=UPI002D242A13|nr:DUF6289 family protein [Brevundimonas sp.]HYC97453.1 DUF6289 family protein [Brevundimonas sp.]
MKAFTRLGRIGALALAIGVGTAAAAAPSDIRRETFWYDDPGHTVLVGHGIIFCDNTTQSWGSKTEYVVSHVYGCS